VLSLQAIYNLDKKDRCKDGTYPLKVRIYRSRTEYFFVGLKIYILPEQWDGKKIVNTPEAAILNGRFNFYRLNIGKVLRPSYNVAAICNCFMVQI
jgi:hypothetical protein